MQTLANTLNEYRKRQRISVMDMVASTGFSKQTIYRYESNEFISGSPTTIAIMSIYLNIPLSRIVKDLALDNFDSTKIEYVVAEYHDEYFNVHGITYDDTIIAPPSKIPEIVKGAMDHRTKHIIETTAKKYQSSAIGTDHIDMIDYCTNKLNAEEIRRARAVLELMFQK